MGESWRMMQHEYEPRIVWTQLQTNNLDNWAQCPENQTDRLLIYFFIYQKKLRFFKIIGWGIQNFDAPIKFKYFLRFHWCE